MPRRVMLWGASSDEPLNAVRRQLIRHRVPHLLLDAQDTGKVQFDLETASGVQGRLRFGAGHVDVAEIGAIYVRARDPHALHAEGTPLEQRLFTWTEITDALVLNRLTAIAANDSKPYQAELIRAHGFEVPPTLATTTPEDVREFVAQHHDVVYKSTSSARSVVGRMGEAQGRRLDDVSNCVTQFQARIVGKHWRVHVIGDDVFACEIQCGADHYRAAARRAVAVEMRCAELPQSIAQRCHTLAHDLDLPLAGFDLRRTDDDAWYCFEADPSPVFTYYERACGQPLTAAVTQLLINAAEGIAA